MQLKVTRGKAGIETPIYLLNPALGETSRFHCDKHAGPLLLFIPFKDKFLDVKIAGPKPEL